MPVIGPTSVPQWSTLSQIAACVPVDALSVSVPAGTVVESEKAASVEFLRSQPVSNARQGTDTSSACQSSPTDPQRTVGGSTSSTFSHIRTYASAPLNSGARSVFVIT